MKKLLIAAFALTALVSCGNSTNEIDELRAGFDNPPQAARPQVWWHWMNGNITKDGIRKDLEWMDRVGMGGFHHFDAALGTPQVVEKRLIYMHDDWKDAFAYAVKVADSLDLQMTVASAPGWSATGGPWVEPKDAMKKLVWRTMDVAGGQHIGSRLPEPFTVTGAYQNSGAEGRGEAGVDEYYEDIAVIAVALPETDKSMKEMGAKITSSSGNFTVEGLSDDDVVNGPLLANEKNGKNGWIQFAFPEAQTIKAVSLADGRGGSSRPGPGGASNATVWLESSNDGRTFTRVADLQNGSGVLRTVDIPETTAKYFRVIYRPQQAARGGNNLFGGPAPAPVAPKGTTVAELVLHTSSRVARAADKAGFTAAGSLVLSPSRPAPTELFAGVEDVYDITADAKDGVLDWDAPEGKWRIYRFGFSLTGKQNHPAPAEATGLEVDKLDPVAWTKYFRTYLDMYKDASGGLMGERGVQYVLNDSYEAEQENWTPAMFEEFKARRGYDLMPWMPVLAGMVVGSPEESDAFLFDWRKTIGELITANYELLSDIAIKEYGMLGRYTEAHEAGRVYPVDGMDVKKRAEVPMSAMWCCAPWLGRTADGEINRGVYIADCQESASVAHIYGQNVAAAESMTAWGNVQYSYSPENLKFVADLELASGINRFVIHESAHQPTDEYVPGLSLGGIGQWFNRHDAWAEQAGVWVDYMAKSSYMLQAGHNVADILVYYGEDSNICSQFGSRQPLLPSGYNFDYLNPDGLINQIEYSKGRLVSKSGTEYKVLWLERNTDAMSLDVLRKIASLAKKGAIIVGSRPTFAPGLMDSKAEFDALVAEVWDSGRKNVYENELIDKVLRANKIGQDIIVDSAAGIRYLHRTLDNTEIYWINKPAKDYLETSVSFRVSGKKPQIWHPDNGKIEDASYRIENGRTIVDLSLVPEDAVFVVFSGKAESDSYELPAVKEAVASEITGPWNIAFQAGRGAPETAVFDELQSYTDSKVFGIKYFSGVADYTKTISISNVKGRTIIDLGQVGNLAEVYVNGQYCGTAWKQPFRVDITDAVKAGDNELHIKVANLWVNRLIGDEQPGNPKQITFTDARHYTADSPLLPSGLMGPVKILKNF